MIKLYASLTSMSENLAYQLLRGNKLTSCVSVKIRYSDFNTHSKQPKIPYTSADHILIPKVQELFKQLYNRRMLIRLIGVKFTDLAGGNYQINLFDDSEQLLNLYNSLDKIRNKYGDYNVIRTVTLGNTIGRMDNPFNGEPPVIPAHRQQ